MLLTQPQHERAHKRFSALTPSSNNNIIASEALPTSRPSPSTQDWFYLALLVLIMASLAACLCTLPIMNQNKAYAGGIFLSLFSLLLLYSLSSWYCHSPLISMGWGPPAVLLEAKSEEAEQGRV